MQKRYFPYISNRRKVGIAIMFMLVLSACSGGNFLSGAAGVSGCNLSGDAKLINNGKAIIVADTKNATVKVISWDEGIGDWSLEGKINPRSADPSSFKVPNYFLTTAYWFSIKGCGNWHSANELLSPLVTDVETNGGSPNDDDDLLPGDPVSGSSESTDPSCLDQSSSSSSDCPVDSSDGGGSGAYGD